MKNTPSLVSRDTLTLALGMSGLLLSGLLLRSMSGAGSAIQAG
jgi:hypothetical protein